MDLCSSIVFFSVWNVRDPQKVIQNKLKRLRWSVLVEIGNALKLLAIAVKSSILQAWLGSEYTLIISRFTKTLYPQLY